MLRRITQSGGECWAVGQYGSAADLLTRYDVTVPKLAEIGKDVNKIEDLRAVCVADGLTAAESYELISAFLRYYKPLKF